MTYPLAVTISGQGDGVVVALARARADEWNLPFLARPPKSPLDPLFQLSAALLVFDGQGVVLRDPRGAFRFHSGLAHLRIQAFERGDGDDRLLRAGEVREGDAVLDCTAGLAQDSLVAARAVGCEGRVVGLEKSLALYAAVSEGLRRMGTHPRAGTIEVLHSDSSTYLADCAPRSFDVVLFDPMFERPRRSQPSFELLRRFAAADPLTPDLLARARRVARRWVVVKGARYSSDLKKLGLVPEPASRSATVLFARIGPT